MDKTMDEILTSLNEGDVSDLGEMPNPPADDKEDEAAPEVERELVELADDLADAFVAAMADVAGIGGGAGDDLDQELKSDDDAPPPPPGTSIEDDGEEEFGGDIPSDDDEPGEDPKAPGGDAPDASEPAAGNDPQALQNKVDALEDENEMLRQKLAAATNESYDDVDEEFMADMGDELDDDEKKEKSDMDEDLGMERGDDEEVGSGEDGRMQNVPPPQEDSKEPDEGMQ